jgi:hypothetical protein
VAPSTTPTIAPTSTSTARPGQHAAAARRPRGTVLGGEVGLDLVEHPALAGAMPMSVCEVCGNDYWMSFQVRTVSGRRISSINIYGSA